MNRNGAAGLGQAQRNDRPSANQQGGWQRFGNPAGGGAAPQGSSPAAPRPEGRSGQTNQGQRFASPAGGGRQESLRIAPPVVRERPSNNAPRPSAPSYSAPRRVRRAIALLARVRRASVLHASRALPLSGTTAEAVLLAEMAAVTLRGAIPVEVTATAGGKTGFVVDEHQCSSHRPGPFQRGSGRFLLGSRWISFQYFKKVDIIFVIGSSKESAHARWGCA